MSGPPAHHPHAGGGPDPLREQGAASSKPVRPPSLRRTSPRTHAGLPEPDMLDLGFERAYRVTHATGLPRRS